MQRINVKGTSGAGKSTVGRAVAERLGLAYVELDELHHGPNWTEASPEELQAKVRAFMDAAPDGWVIDGNYDAKLGDLVVGAADTIVWLDLPLATKLRRLWRRTRSRIRGDEKLWNDNVESWRSAFWGRESLFAWAIRSHVRQRRHWPRRFGSRLVRLRSETEVAEWLASLRPRQRVVAYVTRTRRGRKELLVFDLPELPDKPLQVPAGRIDPGESLEDGLRRELYEETGLRLTRIVRQLAGPRELDGDRRPGVVPYENHAFEVEVGETPDQWDHVCVSDGDDDGFLFRCRWVPLAPDLKLWATGSDSVLPHLLA
jgi:adenylate kinase family enzyme/8-oxo-dGTP pyrophosphatase MutT (NUDIX family)